MRFFTTILSTVLVSVALSEECNLPGLPDFFESFCFQSIYGTYLRHEHSNSTVIHSTSQLSVDMSAQCDERNGRWRLWQLYDGTVVIYPQDEKRMFLQANGGGLVEIAGWRYVGRRWAPRKNDDESWSFRSVENEAGWLIVNKNGSVNATNDGSSPTTHFWFTSLSVYVPAHKPYEYQPPSTVKQSEKNEVINCARPVLPNFEFCLKSIHGTYLRREYGTEVAMSAKCEQSGHWEITAYDESVHFRHTSDSYLASMKNGYVHIGGWLYSSNSWMPRSNRDGSWSFRSEDGGRWLNADKNGSIFTTEDAEALAANFVFTSLSDAKSAETGQEADSAENKTTQDDDATTTQASEYGDIYAENLLFAKVDEATKACWNTKTVACVSNRFMARTCALENAERWKCQNDAEEEVNEDAECGTSGHIHFPKKLRTYCSWNSHVCLRAMGNGSVEAANWERDGQRWIPRKNRDGSWSFNAEDRGWLSVDKNGSLRTVVLGNEPSEHFWIESPPEHNPDEPESEEDMETNEMAQEVDATTPEPEAVTTTPQTDTFTAPMIFAVLLIIIIVVCAAVFLSCCSRRTIRKRRNQPNERPLVVSYSEVVEAEHQELQR